MKKMYIDGLQFYKSPNFAGFQWFGYIEVGYKLAHFHEKLSKKA